MKTTRLSAIILSFVLLTSAVFAQNSREFLISYKVNGATLHEILDLNDTAFLPKLKAISAKSESKEYKIEVVSDSVKDIYDEHGNLKVKRVEGYLRFSGLAYEVYTYDSVNRRTSEAAYDMQGELHNNPFGYAYVTMSYDEDGNIAEKRFFDERERPCQLDETGPAIIRYDYDDQHRPVRITYLDERAMLLNNRLAIERFFYNDEGKAIEKLQMDREGRELSRLSLQ